MLYLTDWAFLAVFAVIFSLPEKYVRSPVVPSIVFLNAIICVILEALIPTTVDVSIYYTVILVNEVLALGLFMAFREKVFVGLYSVLAALALMNYFTPIMPIIPYAINVAVILWMIDSPSVISRLTPKRRSNPNETEWTKLNFIGQRA